MTPGIAALDPDRQLLPFRESLMAMPGVAFVAMLVALDQTIVSTALQRIVADLKGFDLYARVVPPVHVGHEAPAVRKPGQATGVRMRVTAKLFSKTRQGV